MKYLCKNCGGELKATGDGVLQCIFCKNEYTEQDFVQQQSSVKEPPIFENNSKNGSKIYNKNINGVLEINCILGNNKVSAGSGFLLSKESGLAITNSHVVTNNGKPVKDIVVKIADKVVNAQVLVHCNNKSELGKGVDLALIELESVPKNAVEIRLEDFDKVENGEDVFVIGNSLGEGSCITRGIVSDKLRNVNGDMLLMTDCPTNPGNSGGPIFNSDGLAIGVIVSGIPSAKGMNFAIPSFTILEFLNAIRESLEDKLF